MVDADGRQSWPALRVEDWTSTRELLHLASQVVGKIRMACEPMVNHWWQVTLYVSARGLTTGVIHHHGTVFELEFDLVDHVLEIRTPEHPAERVELRSGSIADFSERVTRALEQLGLAVEIWPVPVELPEVTAFADDHVVREYSPRHARLFWRQLVVVDRVLKRFRSEFAGKVSPVHFFWGGFDMAVTRFSGRPAPVHPGGAPNSPEWVMVEGYSHELSSCGFWPGGGDEGAFYAYAYPEPDGYRVAEVGPAGASYDESAGLFLLPYELVRNAADPDAAVLRFLRDTHRAAAELAGWDPQLDYVPVPHA